MEINKEELIKILKKRCEDHAERMKYDKINQYMKGKASECQTILTTIINM